MFVSPIGRWAAVACLVMCLPACDRPVAKPPVKDPEVAEPVTPVKRSKQQDERAQFFGHETVLSLKIVIPEGQVQRLREEPRKYARCTLIENGTETYESVAIKLKGAAGSFREFDDRPALTLNMDKHRKGQRFHGLDKWHLNNSAQDESFASEFLVSHIAHAIGVPAARVQFARVWINDRDLGLYVLKEGFDRDFLKDHFEDVDGNLYDGGFVTDIDAPLEKDSGKGPDDHSDLKALFEASQIADPDARAVKLAELLDIDAFLKLTALELMTCHWDGYIWNKNNYRIYFEPQQRRAHFFPHGMDQMFGDANFPLLEHPPSILGAVVMQNPEWRKKYRAELRRLLPTFAADNLVPIVDTVARRIRPVLQEINPDSATALDDRIRELKERITARAEALKEMVEAPEPQPIEFDDSQTVVLTDWYPEQETEAVIEHDEKDGVHGEYRLAVQNDVPCVASWRRKVFLAQGRYYVEAQLKSEGIAPREDEPGHGAGVRISGGRRDNRLAGDTDWQAVRYEFDVAEPAKDVVLVIELRATHGRLRLNPEVKLVRRGE